MVVCRREFCHCSFFPSFRVKNGKVEMSQICDISVCSWSIEMTQNWPEIAVPSHKIKGDWDCSLGPFSLFIWVLNVMFGLFGPKNALNGRNVKHEKRDLSKNGQKLRRQTTTEVSRVFRIHLHHSYSFLISSRMH